MKNDDDLLARALRDWPVPALPAHLDAHTLAAARANLARAAATKPVRGLRALPAYAATAALLSAAAVFLADAALKMGRM